MCLCACTFRYQWRPEEDIRFLKLELQVVVCCQMWVLEIKFWSSVRAISTFNCSHLFAAVMQKLLFANTLRRQIVEAMTDYVEVYFLMCLIPILITSALQ